MMVQYPERSYPNDLQKLLYLWFANPNDMITATDSDDCAQFLSEAERTRWRSFRFEKDRREYLATRLLVRSALSHYRPLPPDAWRFQIGDCGKPSVYPDCGLRFNLSNSTRLVVCLIGEEDELGIDAEPFSRAPEIAKLGNEFLSAPELAQLEVLQDQEKYDRVLSLWTLKEAYTKARGLGFSMPLKKFSFLFDESNGIRLELDSCLNDNPKDWRFCLLNLDGHRVALLVATRNHPTLQIWECRPPGAALVREIVDVEQRWFPSAI
jgi:4'-phosphopantetheinyl transferase